MYSNFEWIVLGLLCVLLLLPKIAFLDVPGTYVNVRIEDFLVLFVYVLWFIGILAGRLTITEVFQWRSIILFLVYGLVITLLGIWIWGTIDSPLLGVLHWARRVEYMTLYLIAASVTKRSHLVTYLQVLFIVSVLIWVYGILQWKNIVPGFHTLSKPGTMGTYDEISYVISTFGAHYDFGAFLIWSVMLSVWAYFSVHKPFYKILSIVAIAAFWWMSLLAFGRSAYLGLLIGMIVVFIFARNIFVVFPILELSNTIRRYFDGRFGLYEYEVSINIAPLPTSDPSQAISPTPNAIVTLAPSASGPTSDTPSILEKIGNGVSENISNFLGRFNVNLDPSGNIRLVEWREALVNAKGHLLFGSGYYGNQLGADNDYLRHILEVGFIGLCIFGYVVFNFIRAAFKLFFRSKVTEEKYFYLACIGFIAGLLVEALFIDVFASSKIAFLFWFLMGLLSVHIQEVSLNENRH